MPMLGTVWAWISATIGLAVLALVLLHGFEFGTWMDEAGPLPVSPPDFTFAFTAARLSVVLLIGGFIVGAIGIGERGHPRP